MTDEQKQAIERVSKYIAERAQSRGLDQNEIHGFHIGDERETILLVDDLKALLQAASAAPAQEPTGTVAVPVDAYLWLMGLGKNGFVEDRRGKFWWRSAFNERAGLDMIAIYEASRAAPSATHPA